jgi:hypothetical protein
MKAAPLHERVSKAQLERLYVRERLTTLALAERLSTNRESVRKLIHRYGLPMRSKGTGMANKRRR